MYPQIPSSVVRNGLIQGYKCPISGREFVAFEATKSVLADLYRQQQDHTRAVMSNLDGGNPNLARTLESYRGAYQASNQ